MIVIHAGYFRRATTRFLVLGSVQTTTLFSDRLPNRTKPVRMTGGGES
jgi:hypothetical protein